MKGKAILIVRLHICREGALIDSHASLRLHPIYPRLKRYRPLALHKKVIVSIELHLDAAVFADQIERGVSHQDEAACAGADELGVGEDGLLLPVQFQLHRLDSKLAGYNLSVKLYLQFVIAWGERSDEKIWFLSLPLNPVQTISETSIPPSSPPNEHAISPYDPFRKGDEPLIHG